MSDLLFLQRDFRRALDRTQVPGGIAPGWARGIAVHRMTITAGLVSTLVKAFPALRRVVGPPAFAALASEFAAAAPPRAPGLATYGRDFPQFVAAQPTAGALAYLPDLARLEWARQEAYLAADAAPLDTGRIVALDADALSALTLRLHPATRLIASPFPVYRIWRVNRPDVDDADIPHVDMSVGEHVVITRPKDEVVTRVISAADGKLLGSIARGANLGQAVDGALALDPGFDVKAALAAHFAAATFADQPRMSKPVRASRA